MDATEEPEFDDLGAESNKETENTDEDEAYPQPYPIRVNVVITKVCTY